MNTIRVGTRGSLLATTQTGFVVEALQKAHPDAKIETIIIKTTGDANQKLPLTAFGVQGVFVKELEMALEQNEIDLAVHSLKDVPHAIPNNMQLAAFFNREDCRDVFISNYSSWQDLPTNAIVGTGSPRRRLQLQKLRPDLKFTELRGNIDTRLAKADSGDMDAIVLAAAGLNRLGLTERTSKPFSIQEMLPAIAQGIVAIETRKGDLNTISLLAPIESQTAKKEASIERYFMEKIGGGCKVPMAALAQEQESLDVLFEALLGESPDNIHRQSIMLPGKHWENKMDIFIKEFNESCRQLKIPLPSELPDHQLLHNNDSNH